MKFSLKIIQIIFFFFFCKMIHCILNTNSTIVLAPVVIYISLRHAVQTFQIFLSFCLISVLVARTVMTIKNNYGYLAYFANVFSAMIK